ncbi:IS66 C-terminal element [bacterium A37T11]|nr:IS66 C-terminal element [bacterium A37T11]
MVGPEGSISARLSSTHRGYFWVGLAPPENIVFFEYQPGRNQEIPQELLKNFSGVLQSDGYECYNTLSKREDITLCCCLAHARRYFEQSQGNDKVRSTHALNVFGRLYDIEREHKESTPEERLAARQQYAKPTWQEFGRWLEDQVGLLAPGSAIHKAFAYTMRRFKRLSRYMDDGTIKADNNLIENSIRPAALGKKNYMFCGSHEGARRVALLYSLIGTCRMHGINPVTWMTEVLRRISTHPKESIHELLPNHWKELNLELAKNEPLPVIVRVDKSKRRTA